MMNKFNGNTIYKELEAKLVAKQELTDIDMLNLIFLPLMKSKLSKNELALKSVELAKTIEDRSKRETCIVSTVAFMRKYLNENQINQLWEAIRVDSVIGSLIQKEVDVAVDKERLNNAKSLLDILSIEIITKKFKLSKKEVDELKQYKEQAGDNN